jgi:hypothetical protein
MSIHNTRNGKRRSVSDLKFLSTMKGKLIIPNMEFDKLPMSLEDAMNVMSDEDLTFIASYNPPLFKQMCLMLSLEKQLKVEGKSLSNISD